MPIELEALLASMTIEEKVGQLNLAPNEDEVDAAKVRSGEIGNVICAASAWAGNERQQRIDHNKINELQRIARKESRLGIPLLIGRDVIHGHRTVAPIPLGQACSWSPEDVEACANVAADEAAAEGIRWVYTPMLDIARDPRWGRIAEGYGEDPFLASQLAKAAVRGLQGGEGGKLRVAACAKHFAGYGSVEGGRDYNSGEIGPFTMRNIYLPPFKAAVAEGIASIMTCFNDLGGVPATADPCLVRQILKKEWGFKGFTVSDWNAIAELMQHGVAEDARNSAGLAIRAGIDMDMAADAYSAHLASLVKSGEISEEMLNESALRVLLVKRDLRLFDNPYTDAAAARGAQLTEGAKRSTLELCRKCVVMLKNDGLLPFDQPGKIGIFGPFAEEQAGLLGTWCLDGREEDVVPMREAFEQEFGQNRITSMPFTHDAAKDLRSYGLAIACLGEFPGKSGEANSVCDLRLPQDQIEMVRTVKDAKAPVLAVVFAGRPLDLSELGELADSILYVFHPGLYGAVAVAEIVAGKLNPSGRLPVTFPRSVGQIPIYYNHRPTGRPTDSTGVSRYVDGPDSPLFPFGFGLSYGSVAYEDLSVAPRSHGFKVSCTLRNHGEFSCEEVPQLYVRDLVACAARPVKELKGFQRVRLKPGEMRRVEFELGEAELGYYGPDEKWRFEPGDFAVWVGPHAAVGESAMARL